MAYVGQRGRQPAIVEGQRDPSTGRACQGILFTIFSRPEALEVLRRGSPGGADRFQSLFKYRYPNLRIDWKKTRGAIAANLEVLPESYEYKAARLHDGFRSGLCAFTRQLALADPQMLFPAAQLIAGHRHELIFLKRLIDWRLMTCDQRETDWNRGDDFFWRFALADRGVPSEVEEMASEFYQKGQHKEAGAVYRLLLESFGEYAEGHNCLGLIALDRGDLDEVAREFERTIELGRRKFPRRIARKDWWSRDETRVCIRGIRNLCLTLNRAGKYDEALALCRRLDQECNDDVAARYYEARIFLNTGRWREALAAADHLHHLYPEENLLAALAAFELGLGPEAAWRFLHAALTHPRAAHMLLGRTAPKRLTDDSEDVRDHNTGVDLRRDLRGFLARPGGASRRSCRSLLSDPRVGALLAERAATIARWRGPHEPGAEWRAAFDRMREMGSPELALQQAQALFGMAERSEPRGNGLASRRSLRRHGPASHDPAAPDPAARRPIDD